MPKSSFPLGVRNPHLTRCVDGPQQMCLLVLSGMWICWMWLVRHWQKNRQMDKETKLLALQNITRAIPPDKQGHSFRGISSRKTDFALFCKILQKLRSDWWSVQSSASQHNYSKQTNHIRQKFKLSCLNLWALLIAIAIRHTIINKHNLTWQIAL